MKVPSINAIRNVGAVVLEAFGYVMPPGCTVNHKNHDRGDNRLKNLEWATAAEQATHRRKSSTVGPRRGIEYRFVGEAEWSFAHEISDAITKTGCKIGSITKAACETSRNKTAAGLNGRYEFRWADGVLSNNLEDEVWRPIVVEDWSPGGKYDVPGLR